MLSTWRILFLIYIGVFLFISFLTMVVFSIPSANNRPPSVLHAVDSSSPLHQYRFSSEQLHCLAHKLGENRYSVLVAQGFGALTNDEQQLIEVCWNTTGLLPPEPSPEFVNMDPAVAACWRGKIGEYRYEHIVSVGFEPTATEYSYLQQCYSQTAPPPDGQDNTTTSTDDPGTTQDNNSTTSAYSTYGERFPVGSPKRDCVKKALGTDFAWFNNTANPNATSEYKRFELLEKKAETCFQTYPPPASTYEPKLFLTPEMITCLKNAFGETRFNNIYSGKSIPTPLEGKKIQTCHAKFYEIERPTVEYQDTTTLDKETESCLKIAVGEKRYKKISAGAAPTFQELNKGGECFGASTSPLAPPPVLKISDKIKSCIDSAIGKDRLAKIRSGEVEPTEGEKNKVSACFKNINKVQLAFLPLPPEQVPFLGVDKTKASINKVETKYVKNKSGKEEPVVTFSGKGLPKATVDLYFFSDPIVVTVDTDANGDWTYNLDVPLDSGNHIAYVTAKTGGGEAVRSEVFRFSVAQAAASGDKEGGLIVKNTDFRDQIMDYLVWVIGLVVIGVVALVSIVIYRGKRKAQATATPATGKQP